MTLKEAIGHAIESAAAQPGKRFGVYSVVVAGMASYIVRADYNPPERVISTIGHACTLPNSSLVAWEERT